MAPKRLSKTSQEAFTSLQDASKLAPRALCEPRQSDQDACKRLPGRICCSNLGFKRKPQNLTIIKMRPRDLKHQQNPSEKKAKLSDMFEDAACQ